MSADVALQLRIERCERVLSLTQPWAWCIVSMPGLWKNVENRKPGFSHKSFRGDFFVHAAKRCRPEDYRGAVTWIAARFGVGAPRCIPPLASLPLGGIVGMSRVTDIVAPSPEPRMQWHMSDQYGFVLDDRVALPFVECRGHLGFFMAKDLLRDRIVRQLRMTP